MEMPWSPLGLKLRRESAAGVCGLEVISIEGAWSLWALVRSLRSVWSKMRAGMGTEPTGRPALKRCFRERGAHKQDETGQTGRRRARRGRCPGKQKELTYIWYWLLTFVTDEDGLQKVCKKKTYLCHASIH